jgi:DMSO/TMAO reductase YedYZ molybdopterin-dependent catalytic subunit
MDEPSDASLRAPRDATSGVGRGAAAAAGMAGVAVALGTGELLAGLVGSVASPVAAVGSAVIPLVPPWLEDWAITTFGTSDKAVLATGVVVVGLAIGAHVGVRARRGHRAAIGWFAVFALLGLVASLGQPGTAVVPATLALTVVAVAGVATLWWLLRLAQRAASVPVGVTTGARRAFLVAVGGAGLGAVAATLVGRRWLAPTGRPGGAVPTALPSPRDAATPVGTAQAFADVDGLTPIVVPNERFYRIDTAFLGVPRVDAGDWSLRVHGMVERELELTYADLTSRAAIERYVTIACVSNEVGDDLVGNAAWLGVPLRGILEEAGIAAGADQVVGRSVDGWTAGFPTDAALDGRDAMVAVGMNGEPLPLEHGYPARLIVPGLYGYVSATKWLTEIELTTFDAFDAYWVPRGWAGRAPIKTQSRIDVPRADRRIAPGEHEVAGVAWAPTRGIARVEVQLDDRPWVEAERSEPLSDDAWVQWRTRVTIDEGVHFLRVRATDGTGDTQTEDVAPPRPDGATGWHTIRVFT